MVEVSKETELWIIEALKENIKYFSDIWNRPPNEKVGKETYEFKCSNERILNLFTSKNNKTIYK